MSNYHQDHQDNRLGLLVCGHGSRNRLAIREFANLATSLSAILPEMPLEYGYLEFAQPIIETALDKLVEKSVDHVIALPAMLFAAGHAKNDIPALLNEYSLKNNLRIDYGRELGVNSLMIGAAGARIKEAIKKANSFPNSETLLVVVGRGSSDPDANSNVSKITRMLVEGFGFGWGETVFSGVTFPLVEPGLRHAVRLGFKRIIVFPYFLFSGVLVGRIRQHTMKIAKEFPGIEFIQAQYLGDHPLVLSTFKERMDEVIKGENSMNCSLCKYRANVLGFEKEVGKAQVSHHNHVEGSMDCCNLCELECIGLCEQDLGANPQKHSHQEEKHEHHHPYPHAEHPLGPVTLRKQNTAET